MIKKIANKVAKTIGFSIVKTNKPEEEFKDVDDKHFWDVYNFCKEYTMTSVERMYALYNSVKYVIENNIEGDFVECGVWRGGSSMLIAKVLLLNGISNRKYTCMIHLKV